MLHLVKKLSKQDLCYIGFISLAYLVTHGFIIFVTGTWWDEKTFLLYDNKGMLEMTLQLGRPSAFFLLKLIFSLPERLGYALIFLLYYCSTLGVFYIFKHISLFNDTDACFVTLLYIAIPANDARIMRGVFPYTVGHCFFILAFCLLILLHIKYNYRNIGLRVVDLSLFFCSFILNSNLVLYVSVIAYIIVSLYKQNEIKTLLRFIDFAVIPFVYFFSKNVFFVPYGIGAGYNEVTWHSMLNSIGNTFQLCIRRVQDVFLLWSPYVAISFIISAIVVTIIMRINSRLLLVEEIKINELVRKMIFMVIGIGLIFLSIFPYKVIGQDCVLIGMDGRSSILIPIGASVVLYALLSLIPLMWLKTMLCVCVSICGAFHFNTLYMTYQMDYYRQLDLTYELNENKSDLVDCTNILYLTDSEPIIQATRFYTLNYCAYEAFGDQTRFIMNGINDYVYLTDEWEDTRFNMDVFVGFMAVGMRDYPIGKTSNIQAVIVYRGGPNIKDIIPLKIYEIIDKEKFRKELFYEKNMQVYSIHTDELDLLQIKNEFGLADDFELAN